MKTDFDYNSMPVSFAHCLNGHCLRADKCLRRQVTLRMPKERAAVTVINTGKCEGEEVVQLYVRDEVASITRPIKELKGFEKIKLSPGESKTVTFDVKDEQLGFYNNQMKFIVEKGDFTLMVGGNSRDLQEIKYILN